MISRFLCLLAAWSLLIPATHAQTTTYFSIPPVDPRAISNRDRGPNGSVDFQRTAFIYTAADMAQGAVPANTTVNSIGFCLRTPAPTVATGTLKMWVSNGVIDASFTRSTTWTTLLSTPTPLTLVYDGPLTIPTSVGWYDVVFNQPGAGLLVESGKGYYVAYEWTAAAKSAVSATYVCFNRTNTLNTVSGPTPPPVLFNNGGFRPWIRLGASGGVSYPDAGVAQVYALGQLPVLAGVAANEQPALPGVVRALVYNGGTLPLRNLPVTLTITGPNPYDATVTLDSLRPGDTVSVRFGGFRPAIGGRHGVRVSVPSLNDSIPLNNAITDSLFVSARRLTYAKGFPPGNDPYFTYPVGFASGEGAAVVRHTLNRIGAVSHVGFAISNSQANIGRTVYALLLDSTGRPLTPPIPHVILATELGEYVREALPAPVVVRGVFFAGLGQPAGGPGQAAFYPMGAQGERPVVRDSAYYVIPGDLQRLGQTPPVIVRNVGRFVVGVDLVPAPVGLAEEKLATNSFALWPNPAREQVSLTGAAPRVELAVYDATGRRVRTVMTTTEGTATLDLMGLARGVYAVRVEGRTRRLVID